MAYSHGGYAGYHPSNGFQEPFTGLNHYQLVPPRPGSLLLGSESFTSKTVATGVLNGGAGMTANEYQHKICVIDTGVDAGVTAVIKSNTTTTITLGAYLDNRLTAAGAFTVKIYEPSDVRCVMTHLAFTYGAHNSVNLGLNVIDVTPGLADITLLTHKQLFPLSTSALEVFDRYIYSRPGGELRFTTANILDAINVGGFYGRDFDISLML